MKKRIGVITSGGDAQGMNAAVRALVCAGHHYGVEVFGFHGGYRGVLDKAGHVLTLRDVESIIHRGGTIIKSARCLEFKDPVHQQRGAQNIRELGIDGMVVCGGDGSFMGARVLSNLGIPTIGIPTTIDNDMPYTERTIGFDTAVNIAMEAIDTVRDTALSHDRVFLIEVMGRNCGDIALHAGIAGGAEVVLLPEKPWTPLGAYQKLKEAIELGERASIVVVAEGAYHISAQAYAALEEEEKALMEPEYDKSGNLKGYAVRDADKRLQENRLATLEEYLAQKSGADVRALKLGHLQRGGNPTAADRNLATRMSVHALRLVVKGTGNRAIGVKDNIVYDMDIMDALGIKRPFEEDFYQLIDVLRG